MKRLRSIDLGNIPGKQLLVPADRDFLEWHNSDKQVNSNQGIVQDNPVLNSYLQVKHVNKLGPDTKIPLGILILSYNMYLPENRTARLQDLKEIGDATVGTRFPFGILLGADIRKVVLTTFKKHPV